jgi:glutathione S-transferase
MNESLTLHQDPRSGNCYKITLTAALLGTPLAVCDYDIMQGQTRTPEFLAAVNPNGRIPVLQIGEGATARLLPESNAACWFLGQGSALVPDDRFAQADVLRWMFFEQYNHEPNVATLRFWLRFVGQDKLTPEQRSMIPAKRSSGDAALRLMDDHLQARDWFVGDGVSLADIALFAYTHVCEQGGFALSDYPAVGVWLDRVRALPAFVPMES